MHVKRYVLRRLALSLVTLFLLVLIVFLIVNVLPSNPARQILGPFAPQSQVDAVNEEIGFTDPKLTQFGRLLKGAVTFDYGESYQFKVPVVRPAVAGARPVGEARRLRPHHDDPAGHRRRVLRRPPAQHARRPLDRHARPGQLVDPRLRLRRDAAVPDRREARLVPRAGAGAAGLRASSRSSTTSCCRRSAASSCTSATSPA